MITISSTCATYCLVSISAITTKLTNIFVILYDIFFPWVMWRCDSSDCTIVVQGRLSNYWLFGTFYMTYAGHIYEVISYRKPPQTNALNNCVATTCRQLKDQKCNAKCVLCATKHHDNDSWDQAQWSGHASLSEYPISVNDKQSILLP